MGVVRYLVDEEVELTLEAGISVARAPLLNSVKGSQEKDPGLELLDSLNP